MCRTAPGAGRHLLGKIPRDINAKRANAKQKRKGVEGADGGAPNDPKRFRLSCFACRAWDDKIQRTAFWCQDCMVSAFTVKWSELVSDAHGGWVRCCRCHCVPTRSRCPVGTSNRAKSAFTR